MRPSHALRAARAILWRELLRFVHQRGRFIASLVRPLLWLFVFAAGIRAVAVLATAPPSATPVAYEAYIVPGLVGMIQLFAGMQSSLSMVYDREMGFMRVLLTSPLPRWFLLVAKLLAGALVSLLQAYAFLAIAAVYGIRFPASGYLLALPALLLTGLALGSVGLLLSSLIRQLENFAGVMNFVIFPTFFLSSALYPLSKMSDSSAIIYWLCQLNPFTHMVELIRFTLHGRIAYPALALTAATLAIAAALAVLGYDPRRGLIRREVA
jgi:ABC-2 type transport system permease protein